jgi:hypothetical protein
VISMDALFGALVALAALLVGACLPPGWGGQADTSRTHQGVSDPVIIGRPLQVNTEVARVPVVVTGPNPELELEVTVHCYIGFRNGIGCANLRQAASYVAAVIREFAPPFEDPKVVALWQTVEGRFKMAGGKVLYIVRHQDFP